MCRFEGVVTVQNVALKLLIVSLSCRVRDKQHEKCVVMRVVLSPAAWKLVSIRTASSTSPLWCIWRASIWLKPLKDVAVQTRWQIRSSTVQLFASRWEFHLDLLWQWYLEVPAQQQSLTQMNIQILGLEDTTLLDLPWTLPHQQLAAAPSTHVLLPYPLTNLQYSRSEIRSPKANKTEIFQVSRTKLE